MANPLPTYADARRAMLKVLAEKRSGSEPGVGRRHLLEETSRALGAFGDRRGGRLVFAAFDDLYRSGIINWGLDLTNPGMEWCHLSEHGVASIENIDRDPSNPKGYIKAIEPYLKDQDIALSYLAEALDTFNKGTVKAAAVMLGCTVEALSLSLRDQLKVKITSKGGALPNGLDDWRIATVLRTMGQQLDGRVTAMPKDLRERYQSSWTAWTSVFRMTRNEVGHPTSIEPVKREQVHGHFLMLHEHARLVFDLGNWIDSHF